MTNSFIMHLEYVGGKAFGAGCFVVAEGAEVGLDMGVEMPLQAPVIHSLPGAVGTSVHLLSRLLLHLVPLRLPFLLRPPDSNHSL